MNRPTRPTRKAKPAGRTLGEIVRSAPKLFAAKAARAKLAAWLDEIAATADGKAIKRIVAASTKLRDTLAAIGETSPYLWDLIATDPARLLGILGAEPD